MDRIPGLGTETDRGIRVNEARVDTAERRERVDAARELIYDKGYVVNAKNVDAILKEDSSVPTEVSSSPSVVMVCSCDYSLECIFVTNQ